MLPQIGRLGAHYTDWVHLPVDRPLRLFRSDWLEMLTKTPWWLVPLFWVPAIAGIIHVGWQRAAATCTTDTQITIAGSLAGSLAGGLLLWTCIEYALHRWVFHMETRGASVARCTVHFVLHGLHHKVPFDPYRLVFPPVPAVVLASVFYAPIAFSGVRMPELVLAGGLAGEWRRRREILRERIYNRLLAGSLLVI